MERPRRAVFAGDDEAITPGLRGDVGLVGGGAGILWGVRLGQIGASGIDQVSGEIRRLSGQVELQGLG